MSVGFYDRHDDSCCGLGHESFGVEAAAYQFNGPAPVPLLVDGRPPGPVNHNYLRLIGMEHWARFCPPPEAREILVTAVVDDNRVLAFR